MVPSDDTATRPYSARRRCTEGKCRVRSERRSRWGVGAASVGAAPSVHSSCVDGGQLLDEPLALVHDVHIVDVELWGADRRREFDPQLGLCRGGGYAGRELCPARLGRARCAEAGAYHTLRACRGRSIFMVTDSVGVLGGFSLGFDTY